MWDQLPQHMQEKIYTEPNTGCWLWAGARYGLEPKYGLTWDRVTKKKISTHRFVYEHLIGPIPDNLELDHKCRVRLCCNPHHLEPVTHAKNVRRGLCAPKSHCIRGHFKGEGQPCKQCEAARQRRYRAEKRALKPPRTHCANGHEWNSKNIGVRQGTAKHYCRVCNSLRTQVWRMGNARI